MKCKSCDAEKLFAKIGIQRDVPLAARGGAVKVGGIKVSQLDLKEAWENDMSSGEAVPRVLRGPILCGGCGAEHFYVVGAKEPLLLGSYDEAIELGAEAFLE